MVSEGEVGFRMVESSEARGSGALEIGGGVG
jgi:hypothetical protein